MLERTATCLESGGRQLLQARKRALRSRRMLHSSFWHHGASELNLPIWWASAFMPDCAVRDSNNAARSGPHTTGTARQSGVLLDFLYPARTLAFLQRLSKIGRDAVDNRRTMRVHTGNARQFSTTSSRVQQTSTSLSRSADVDRELEARLRGSTAIDALQALLAANENGKQELALRLYKSIPETERTSSLQVEFLDYLGSSTDIAHASPATGVFGSIPSEERTSSSYRVAISAYLKLDMVGLAVRLHGEAANHGSRGDFGTSLVLRRTVQDNRWDRALSVYESFHNLPHENIWESTSWELVEQCPDLRGHWANFLKYLRKHRNELKLARPQGTASRFFAERLFKAACKQVVASKTRNEKFLRHFFLNAFHEVHRLKLRTRKFYDTAIFEINAIPRYREYSSGPNILIQVYERYRAYAIEQSEPFTRPSIPLLQALLAYYSKHGNAEGVDSILGDWRRFHPQEPIRRENLFWLMDFHAEHGRADRVEQYFAEYCSNPANPIDLHTLSRLLFVHARRVDIAATTQQFRRISEEFRLTPDRKCWNILLLAYARADDLDGSLGCLNDFLQSGITPDKFTFGPLLDLCAGRGDLEAFETLYSKAEQFNIPIGNEAVIRTGYVEVFLNASDPESAYGIAHRMLHDHRAGTLDGSLSAAWNMLINYHGLKGDIRTSRQLYNEMVENKIPANSWTYGALMRALVEIGQTNSAFKILRKTMPAKNVRVYAFHYALAMTGFLREGQYHLASVAYDHMVEHKVSQTVDSRLKALEFLVRKELQALEASGEQAPVTRLKAVEDYMREILIGDPKSELAHREPRHNVFTESRRQNAPEAYFGLLISLYSSTGAYDICKEMFEAATSSGSENPDYEPPISLLTALMEAHLQAGEHAEVDKCWGLVHSQADSLVKTFAAINTEPTSLEFGSILDPDVKIAHTESKISNNRRQILVKPARIYIRSLLRRPGVEGLEHAHQTFAKLLMQGYVLDVVTWNDFIQMLALRGRRLDAFTICESFLMDGFPGWRTLNPNFYRKDRPGYRFMETRHWDVTPDARMPKYKTLVVLAGAYAWVKRQEDAGHGYDPEMGGHVRDVLMDMAPMTLRAMESMPRVRDGLQEEYIYGG